jgi:hypothetical protein
VRAPFRPGRRSRASVIRSIDERILDGHHLGPQGSARVGWCGGMRGQPSSRGCRLCLLETFRSLMVAPSKVRERQVGCQMNIALSSPQPPCNKAHLSTDRPAEPGNVYRVLLSRRGNFGFEGSL